jgi:hypothetical protein
MPQPGIPCKKNPPLIDLGKAFIFGKITRIGGVIPKETKPLGKLSKHSISNKFHSRFTSGTSRPTISVTCNVWLISSLGDGHLGQELLHME